MRAVWPLPPSTRRPWATKRSHGACQPASLSIGPQCVRKAAIPRQEAFQSDRLHDTINYAAVADFIRRECDAHHFRLLERMADHLARAIITEFKTPYVKLEVVKLGILKGVKHVGVVVERSSS